MSKKALIEGEEFPILEGTAAASFLGRVVHKRNAPEETAEIIEEVDGLAFEIRSVLAHEAVVDVLKELLAIERHEIALEVELDIHSFLCTTLSSALHHLLDAEDAKESAFMLTTAIRIINEAAFPPG